MIPRVHIRTSTSSADAKRPIHWFAIRLPILFLLREEETLVCDAGGDVYAAGKALFLVPRAPASPSTADLAQKSSALTESSSENQQGILEQHRKFSLSKGQ